LLEVALTLLLAKFILEERKGFGFLITGALRFGFEFLRLLLGYLSDEYLGSLISLTVELILLVIFIGITAFLCIRTIHEIRIRELIPKDVPMGASKKQQMKQRQEKRAWSEMHNLSQKNLSNIAFDDPYEKKEDKKE